MALVWKALLAAQVANALDWATTVFGVAVLRIPEANPAALALMKAAGPVWGITLFKCAVGFELAGVVGAALWFERRPASVMSPVCAAVLAVAAALMGMVAWSNLQVIAAALAR